MVVTFVKSFLSCKNIERAIQVIAKESKRLTPNGTDSNYKWNSIDVERPLARASEANIGSRLMMPFGGTEGKRTLPLDLWLR